MFSTRCRCQSVGLVVRINRTRCFPVVVYTRLGRFYENSVVVVIAWRVLKVIIYYFFIFIFLFKSCAFIETKRTCPVAIALRKRIRTQQMSICASVYNRRRTTTVGRHKDRFPSPDPSASAFVGGVRIIRSQRIISFVEDKRRPKKKKKKQTK